MNAPLRDFQEGQWWIQELDAMAASITATDNQKRAVSTVHHLLRAARDAETQSIAKHELSMEAKESIAKHWAEGIGLVAFFAAVAGVVTTAFHYGWRPWL